MNTETPNPGVGTPLENGAGEAIALDVCALDPDEVIEVARAANEGNTMVVPPRTCQSLRAHQPQEAFDMMRRIQEETMLDPEGPTGA